MSHSANVSAVLIVAGQRLPLRMLSPMRLHLAETAEIHAGLAIIELVVDQSTRLMNVEILRDCKCGCMEVEIRHVVRKGN